ncbi:phenylacetic acid degradation protein, partial [bacterium]
MLASLLFMSVAGSPPPSPLGAYLARPEAWSSRVAATTPERTTIELISGEEYGHTWRHQLLIQRPKRPSPDAKGAILYVTGDGPRAGDELELNLLSNASGLTIAMLFDVPNQPLALPNADGTASEAKREDELIAETFARNIEDGGKTPPLLFPMTRAAMRAMDAVQKETGLDRFVVIGASKRGWTTWLAGTTGDPRIRGIAPMVYDNLNLPAQMRGQIAAWGGYSEMIEAYTALGLQAKLE